MSPETKKEFERLFNEIADLRKRVSDTESNGEPNKQTVSISEENVNRSLISYQVSQNKLKADIESRINGIEKELEAVSKKMDEAPSFSESFEPGDVAVWSGKSFKPVAPGLFPINIEGKGILSFDGKSISAKDNLAKEALGLTVQNGYSGSLVYKSGQAEVSRIHERELSFTLEPSDFSVFDGRVLGKTITFDEGYVDTVMISSTNHIKDSEGNRREMSTVLVEGDWLLEEDKTLMLVERNCGIRNKIIIKIFTDENDELNGYVNVFLKLITLSNP